MAIQIQSPRDLFLYDLCAMYDIEQKMVRMLPVLAQECMDTQAKQAFTLHEQETQQQSECLEIAAYHDLIEKANNLGLQDCVLLFQQNLQQEVNASTTIATIAHQLGQQQANAVQRPVAAAPMPNQPDAAVNVPTAAQSFVPANPQVPRKPSMTDNSLNSPQVQEGMQIVGSDMGNIGFVREVREDDFLADIPMHRDLYVPFSAIQNVDAERVILNIPGDQIYDMDWPKPPLL